MKTFLIAAVAAVLFASVADARPGRFMQRGPARRLVAHGPVRHFVFHAITHPFRPFRR